MQQDSREENFTPKENRGASKLKRTGNSFETSNIVLEIYLFNGGGRVSQDKLPNRQSLEQAQIKYVSSIWVE